MIRSLAVATAMLLLAGPGLADGSRATVDDAKPEECPDYGSYAVVDSVRQRGPVRAEPYNGCADLPAPRGRPQPQLFIGADVQIGSQTGNQGNGQGTTPDTGTGWPGQSGPSRPGGGGRPGTGTGTAPTVPRPAPVLVPVPGWSRPAH
jgi:hypothetical protein